MTNTVRPPIHPGEILREEFMIPLHLSANALAGALGVTVARINEIVRERRGITADTAIRLGHYFDTTAELWMNLQKRYELESVRRASGATIIAKVKPLPREELESS